MKRGSTIRRWLQLVRVVLGIILKWAQWADDAAAYVLRSLEKDA